MDAGWPEAAGSGLRQSESTASVVESVMESCLKQRTVRERVPEPHVTEHDDQVPTAQRYLPTNIQA